MALRSQAVADHTVAAAVEQLLIRREGGLGSTDGRAPASASSEMAAVGGGRVG